MPTNAATLTPIVVYESFSDLTPLGFAVIAVGVVVWCFILFVLIGLAVRRMKSR